MSHPSSRSCKLLFECGCVFPREKCKKIRINWVWHYICPKHPKKTMIRRINTCEFCLEDFEFSQRGNIPSACPNCRNIKKRGKDESVTLTPLNHPDIQANMDRSDCLFRNDCLLIHADKQFLPCRTCTKYEKEEFETQIFAYNGEFDNFYL